MLLAGPTVTGWLLLGEFIFTLAMALRCYPLQPGGLLAIQAVIIGLTTPESVYEEVTGAFPVILLLIFMVAGIYFLRDLLLFVFTRLILRIRSRESLALMFCAVSAVLSAFLDALTVVAVAVTVGMGFFEVYHRVASGKTHTTPHHDSAQDEEVQVLHRDNLEAFRGFLRALMMHGAVGTAIGGVMTQVGEPQNLLIAEHAGWNFRPVLPGDGARHRAGGAGGFCHLLAGRAVSPVRLRHAIARMRRAPCSRTIRANSPLVRRRARSNC